MNKLLSVLFVVIALVFASSCSEKEAGDVEGILVYISPSGTADVIKKKENERLKLSISIKSEFELSSVRVIRQAENEIHKDTLINESPRSNNYYGELEFLVSLPPLGSNYFEYKVEAIDVNGKKVAYSKYVVLDATRLIETSGITLSSAISTTKQGGYNLISRSIAMADSTVSNIAFYDATDTLNNATQTLSKSWIGVNGTVFVKNNSFKYESATLQNVQAAISSSNASNLVGNLAANDIVLIKFRKNATTFGYAVIKILTVTDNPEADTDAYTFNLKHD